MALTKQERQELFIQQRTAELQAAGKPVDTAALNARFAELSATPEGRKQITAKVQLAQRPPQDVATTLPDFGATPVTPSNEAPTGPSIPTMVYNPVTPSTPTVLPVGNAAADELKAVLRRYGLEGLFDTLNQAVMADTTLVRNADALFGSIRETPIYKERFKGNATRVSKGLPELSEAEYINQEMSYKTNLKNLGMPKGFYDTQEAFANFIANDISPVELAQRIQQGYNAVTQASPEVVSQLKRMVPDLTDGDIAAYFLDPTKSGQEIERKARAAQISAAGVTQGGMQITTAQAEQLAKQGVTAEQAQQGFAQIGQQEQLFRSNLMGEQALTQEQIVAGTLTNDQAAAQRIARRRRGRTAAFETGGSFTGQGGQQTGLTTVGM
jgi:hypothetical protein